MVWIKNLTIVGESIGAVLAASVSVQAPKQIKKIFMFNPYDYDSYFGEGIQIFQLADILSMF